jgi:hypothetical protein
MPNFQKQEQKLVFFTSLEKDYMTQSPKGGRKRTQLWAEKRANLQSGDFASRSSRAMSPSP